MKTNLFALLLPFLFIFTTSCHSGANSGKEQQSDTSRIEHFLNIPLYPGAKMVMLITDDGDAEIPYRTKPATISFTIDHRDSVPAFYEKALGHPFLTDTTAGKKYYKLVFDKEGWEYEIMVGQDTFENKPMFTISVNESPY